MNTRPAIRNQRRPRPNSAGFSLVEMIVVVAILGILAAVGTTAFENIRERSKEGIARSVVEKLNKAIHDYNHAYQPLDTPYIAGNAGDEKAILLSLQYRDPTDPAVGEPFMRPDWKPPLSNNSDDYRYVWRGRSWDLLLPGETGAGLKVMFDGSDIGEVVVFPADYERFGSH